eukprot:m.48595 g.48595  ORF g.48595 m.48595 type:complete len:217 (+) comp11392_c0_seq2:740-1390(+)
MEEDEDLMYPSLCPSFSPRAMSVMLPPSFSCPQGLGAGGSSEEPVPRPARAMSMAEFFDVKPVRPSIALHPTPSRAPPPYNAPSMSLDAAPHTAAPSLSALAAAASVLTRDPATSAAVARIEHEAVAEEVEEEEEVNDEEGPGAGSPTRLTRDTLAYFTLQQFTLSEKLTRWANCTDFAARPQPSLETASYAGAVAAAAFEDPRRRFGSLVRRTVV